MRSINTESNSYKRKLNRKKLRLPNKIKLMKLIGSMSWIRRGRNMIKISKGRSKSTMNISIKAGSAFNSF